MIVADASAVVAALLHEGSARTQLAHKSLHAPHLLDSEVAHALRRHVARGELSSKAGWAALEALQLLGISRHPAFPVAARVWDLRDNLSAYDATYVALAEQLECSLVTGDAKLSRAPGLHCPITLLPN